MSDAQGSRVGSTFGPYRLKRLLGRGGMGEVYEAEHTVKEWTVAVKLMSETFSKDPVFRERMKREARITGRLQEPHVVPIHDYGEIDGQMYLEMRLIEGTDLDHILKRFGPLTPPRAVAIITQIASALDAAHAAGVMHRDVKPQNILVTRDDFAYLVDFGIASATTDEKLTQLGTAVGTWKYMAPERFSNDEVTYRADIYALACVLHECLTGSPPYRADSASMLVTAHLMDPIPQPSTLRSGIPKAFDAVIARGMAKKPEDRYASAGDLALAAHEALSDPDQDHAADILRRSQEATLPGPPTAVAPPTMPATGMAPSASPAPLRRHRDPPRNASHRITPPGPVRALVRTFGGSRTAGTRRASAPPGRAPTPPPAAPAGQPSWARRAARCRPASRPPPRRSTRAAAGAGLRRAHRRRSNPRPTGLESGAAAVGITEPQPGADRGSRRHRARPGRRRSGHLARHPTQAGAAAETDLGGPAQRAVAEPLRNQLRDGRVEHSAGKAHHVDGHFSGDTVAARLPGGLVYQPGSGVRRHGLHRNQRSGVVGTRGHLRPLGQPGRGGLSVGRQSSLVPAVCGGQMEKLCGQDRDRHQPRQDLPVDVRRRGRQPAEDDGHRHPGGR
ncbi:putative serine/threonine-protein kinase pknH [Mycobacterium kansasii]|uniref:non-specific serine/threonine protein kinase n=1 Tax=Mycobacterium kansasii TaxID=1768 RepID=A0A1V3XL41_MYCKA|nr:putative serine/threonine-protein kinase pknH [Mycobacterium kansasii]